jgi:tetratricopeptide (TPR) repeat protein
MAYFLKGNSLSDMGRCTEALQNYDRAIEFDPEFGGHI